MASTGSALDIRKLLVYPIPHRELFTLEVLLRISTGVEMLLLLGGSFAGLLLNPKVPLWAPFTLVFFVAFNLLFSAGIRDLLVRLLARKRVREITTLLFVMAAALPQLMLRGGFPSRFRRVFEGDASPYWFWTATARLAQGEFSWINAGVLLAWTGAAYFFGRWQFERGLAFDSGEASADTAPRGRTASRLDWFYRLPNAILPDPLAALVEKELRFLSRTPRFRLVFLMGFSFGILIWFPIAFGDHRNSHSFIGDNYLTFVSVYALVILSDTLFWNIFGFDRSAAQIYFLVPVKISTVLLGKNLAAALFIFLEITAVALVCALLRLPLNGLRILEAISVTFVVATFMVAIGNLSSLVQSAAGESGTIVSSESNARAGTVDGAASLDHVAGSAGISGALRFRIRVGIFRRAAGWRRNWRCTVLVLHGGVREGLGNAQGKDYRRAEPGRGAGPGLTWPTVNSARLLRRRSRAPWFSRIPYRLRSWITGRYSRVTRC